MELPHRVKVTKVTNGRYRPGQKPQFWEDRKPGVESIVLEDESEIPLYSLGSQSTPAPGWELLLNDKFEVEGKECFGWTLYGIS